VNAVPTKLFTVTCICIASFLLLWNLDSALSGYPASYLRVLLDLLVILALLLRHPYARILIKIWAALPLISLALFLTASALRGRWSAHPYEHIASLILLLPVFLWVDSAFQYQEKSNQRLERP
jgi:hypothetical protein